MAADAGGAGPRRGDGVAMVPAAPSSCHTNPSLNPSWFCPRALLLTPNCQQPCCSSVPPTPHQHKTTLALNFHPLVKKSLHETVLVTFESKNRPSFKCKQCLSPKPGTRKRSIPCFFGFLSSLKPQRRKKSIFKIRTVIKNALKRAKYTLSLLPLQP